MSEGCQHQLERSVLAIVGRGFEDVELAAYTSLAGWTRLAPALPSVQVLITGFHEVIPSRHGLRLFRDLPLDAAAARDWDAVIVPGGWPDAGYEELYQEPVLSLLRRTYTQGGIIATSCTGIFVAGEAGLLKGRRATTYASPDGQCPSCAEHPKWLAAYGAEVCEAPVVADDRILSDIGPAVGLHGALTLLQLLIGEAAVNQLRKDLLLDVGSNERC